MIPGKKALRLSKLDRTERFNRLTDLTGSLLDAFKAHQSDDEAAIISALGALEEQASKLRIVLSGRRFFERQDDGDKGGR
jgi:hypothetical protein